MYYDDYYEPSEEEIFFDELKEKFKETLKPMFATRWNA